MVKVNIIPRDDRFYFHVVLEARACNTFRPFPGRTRRRLPHSRNIKDHFLGIEKSAVGLLEHILSRKTSVEVRRQDIIAQIDGSPGAAILRQLRDIEHGGLEGIGALRRGGLHLVVQRGEAYVMCAFDAAQSLHRAVLRATARHHGPDASLKTQELAENGACATAIAIGEQDDVFRKELMREVFSAAVAGDFDAQAERGVGGNIWIAGIPAYYLREGVTFVEYGAEFGIEIVEGLSFCVQVEMPVPQAHIILNDKRLGIQFGAVMRWDVAGEERGCNRGNVVYACSSVIFLDDGGEQLSKCVVWLRVNAL